MVSFSKICVVALSAGGVLAAPAPHGPLVKFGELKKLPSSWVATGAADSSAVIKAQIGIKQTNIKGLQDKLADIADPNSPNYGQWLSREEVAKYTAPAAADVAAVKAWLASSGITDVAMPTNDWIEFSVPVSKMETLLGSKYEWFVHLETGEKVPRTKEFSVPQNLHSLIDVVTPTTVLYHNINPHTHDSQLAAGAAGLTSPASIKSAYNVDYEGTGNTLVATTGFLGVGASHADYLSFGRQFSPGLADFQDVSVNGGRNSGDGSALEGNLDTQYCGALAAPNPSEYLAHAPEGSDNDSFNDAMTAFGNYLNAASNPPSAVSTSYGGEEDGVDAGYLDRICNEFMKAGSRGVSVFFSSGDNGVGGNGEPSCQNGYYPLWPASCPYVTTVGGTEFDSAGREVVANFEQYNKNTKSPGGGYSNHFAAPSYNKAVTTSYANGLAAPQKQRLNPNGRGYPDISLVSVKYQVNVNGQISQVLGTSASSPSVAGLVGLLNDYRKTQGKPNLGFINPLLYSGKVNAALRDVTSGSNKGCDSVGLPAKTGWDAASGLGSFDFGKLRTLV
ncbi:family S53 protease [Cordyceps militaris]|uniref:tripeptidyl-peptidase II n=1 Tax=Cordyceps militaris TaxID=73501 RepID=A0A2H4SBH7_CORMI|nr:family S53 protease [Cordyceps militaris]